MKPGSLKLHMVSVGSFSSTPTSHIFPVSPSIDRGTFYTLRSGEKEYFFLRDGISFGIMFSAARWKVLS